MAFVSFAHEPRTATRGIVATRGDEVGDVSLADATSALKTVPPHWYDVAEAFFG